MNNRIKDKYKPLCVKLNENKRAYCKECNQSYFTIIKHYDKYVPGLIYLEMYCSNCDLTHSIFSIEEKDLIK
jgi:hypothetical protein